MQVRPLPRLPNYLWYNHWVPQSGYPTMKTRVLIFLVAGTLGVGIIAPVAISELPQCQKTVQTIVTKLKKNTVTQKTLQAWAAWRIGHPNWKPKPGVTRPKYIKVTEPANITYDVACETLFPPTPPSQITFTFPPEDMPPAFDLPPMPPPDITSLLPPDTPPVIDLPPDEEDDDWGGGGFIPPVFGGGGYPHKHHHHHHPYPPIPPPPMAPTPEPGTLLLTLSGVLGIVAFRLKKQSTMV
jgi:hypothetical protein